MTLKAQSHRIWRIVVVAVFATLLAACASSDPEPVAQQFGLPSDFYPESMAVRKDGTFYVSSFRQGAIAILRPGETTATTFVQ
jgi:streptogramin lyase